VSKEATFPLVVVFGIITVLLVRSRDVKAWEAVIVGLFGFYLGQTPVLYTVDGLVTWLITGFTH
jgi:hypothetical protein